MIGTGDLKKGLTIEMDGQLYTIVDWEHIKTGRGSAQVRLKLKDLRAGHSIEKTFQSGSKFTPAHIEKRRSSYLYSENDLYYFMDTETYEQTMINTDLLGDGVNYIKDGQELEVMVYDEKAIGVELPNSVHLNITDTGPSFKGDTATGGNKPATLETGLIVQVPMFLNIGDTISVDTRTGTYLERVS
ncbi:MAG: elongation factor P [Chloroflexi bacterium]|jgi:elongation factor P|nr:elongation factor P [Chloroflexota bacterium]MBT7080725.1 elongation factor P [Chloroflexota bacterium]